MPEAAVVNISATCVMALALAAGTPKARRLVVDSTPKAMPSAPSTICAQKPTTMKKKKSDVMQSPQTNGSIRISDAGKKFPVSGGKSALLQTDDLEEAVRKDR